MVAVDDSSSMADNHSKQLAFESLATITNAMTLLEVGQVAISRSVGVDCGSWITMMLSCCVRRMQIAFSCHIAAWFVPKSFVRSRRCCFRLRFQVHLNYELTTDLRCVPYFYLHLSWIRASFRISPKSRKSCQVSSFERGEFSASRTVNAKFAF